LRDGGLSYLRLRGRGDALAIRWFAEMTLSDDIRAWLAMSEFIQDQREFRIIEADSNA
jgi:hypothetical protein